MQRSDIHIEQLAHLHDLMEGDVLSDKAKLRLRCILHYLEHDASMAETAELFSTTPHALHRWLNHFDPSNPTSLADKSHRPHVTRSSEIPPHVATLIREYRVTFPKIGKQEIAHKLLQEHNVHVSPSAIGRVIERDCLYFADSPLHKRKRLKVHMAMPLFDVIPEFTTPLQLPKKKWFMSTLIVSALLLSIFLSYGTVRETAKLTRSGYSMASSLLQFIDHYEP